MFVRLSQIPARLLFVREPRCAGDLKCGQPESMLENLGLQGCKGRHMRNCEQISSLQRVDGSLVIGVKPKFKLITGGLRNLTLHVHRHLQRWGVLTIQVV